MVLDHARAKKTAAIDRALGVAFRVEKKARRQAERQPLSCPLSRAYREALHETNRIAVVLLTGAY